MNTLTDKTPTTANPKTNPLRMFEQSAQAIWASNESELEKAAKLSDLGKAVDHYVSRLDDHIRSKRLDAWKKLSLGRSKLYLEQLAKDLRSLAEPSHNGRHS